jgi:Skp family chaperone for outer membrane proteins
MAPLVSRIVRVTTLGACALALVASMAAAQTQPPPTTGTAQQTPKLPMTAPAAPLPEGARIAFVNLQVVFSESNLGKVGQDKWRTFNDKLFAGLAARDKEIQGLTEKIKTQQTIVDEMIVRGWNQDLARLQRELQFARQEAQAQSDQMQQDVLSDFSKKVQPLIDALRAEKGLHAILGVQNEAGGITLLSSGPGMDLSSELIKRLNAQK